VALLWLWRLFFFSFLASTLRSVSLKRWFKRPHILLAPGDVEIVEAQDAIEHVLKRRFAEAREALEYQESVERRNRWARSLLTFGRYVIGGVLATSFIQQVLTPQLIGILGILVVVSTVMQVHCRFDVKVLGSTARGGGTLGSHLYCFIFDLGVIWACACCVGVS